MLSTKHREFARVRFNDMAKYIKPETICQVIAFALSDDHWCRKIKDSRDLEDHWNVISYEMKNGDQSDRQREQEYKDYCREENKHRNYKAEDEQRQRQEANQRARQQIEETKRLISRY
jgi:hypothetical protein